MPSLAPHQTKLSPAPTSPGFDRKMQFWQPEAHDRDRDRDRDSGGPGPGHTNPGPGPSHGSKPEL